MSTGSRVKSHLLKILIVIFIIIFLVSGYKLLDYYLENKTAEDEFRELRTAQAEIVTDTWEEMQPTYMKHYEKNNDFAGWLRVYNTTIDYPVMQTPNDEQYYLRKNFKEEYSIAGTLFASGHSDLDRPSDIITIYGHHMKIGTMFGKLKNYEDPDFIKDHRYIRLDTLKGRHSYEICAVFKVSVAYKQDGTLKFDYTNVIDFPGEEAYNEYMAKVNQYSLYITDIPYQYGDKFILLSTCEYSQKDGRLIVMAKLIPNEDAPVFPKLEE